MPSSARRCLILDFDGVLVDTEPLHFESWQRAFDGLMGIRIAGDYHALVGLSLEQIYRLWAGASYEHLTPDLRQQLLARKTDIFFSLAAEQLQPMPGSIDLLRRAQAAGWYTALVSRALRLRLHRTLDLIHMPALFDLVLGSEDSVDPLTDRKDHARAARMLDIAPAACIVVEDSLSGITDARACGIGTVIGLTSAYDAAALTHAGAHQVIAHLDEVLLNRLSQPEAPTS